MKKRLKNTTTKVKNTSTSISTKAKKTGKRAIHFVDQHPMAFFFGIIIVLFFLIILGSVIRKPTVQEAEQQETIYDVQIYTIGQAPKISVSGAVDKTGVVLVSAQTSGVVNSINVAPGQTVVRGSSLIALSSNYLGGSALSTQRQLASSQYKFVEDTYELQKDTIKTQREIAQKQEDNSEELRTISADSVEDTDSLIKLNEDILNTLNDTLKALEDTNIGGSNDSDILATKQLISQYQSATNAARSTLRNLQLSGGEDKPPAELATLTKDLTLKQLDLQEKTLELNKETAGLQLRLAQISESLAYPVSPFSAVVERVYVNPYEQVNPGDPLVMLSEIEDPASVVVTVPKEIAQSVSMFDPATLYLGSETIVQTPSYISSEPTDGRLFSILFDIPDYLENSVAIGEIVTVELSIGSADTSGAIPFIPIDAVHQTQDAAYVFVAEEGVAVSTEVELGSVQGRYVEIVEGIKTGDAVILDRRVIQGDSVNPL